MASDRSLTVFERCATSKICRRFLDAYLSRCRQIWYRLPASLRRISNDAYGRHLNALIRLQAERKQYFATFFLRNRPELELMRRLVNGHATGSTINISVLGCSKGAEVYSIAWILRSARPDLQFRVQAIDISQEILDFAREGVYSLSQSELRNGTSTQALSTKSDVNLNTHRDQSSWIFERLTDDEMTALFEIEGDKARIRPWLREGIAWLHGDAGDPELIRVLGPQDMVVANCFLCHMPRKTAERCLRNIGRMVKAGGYLFASGIDLNVRTRLARESGWKPVKDLIEEVHEGDPSLRRGWPFEYWGLEPFCRMRSDWKIRYASAFEVGHPGVT